MNMYKKDSSESRHGSKSVTATVSRNDITLIVKSYSTNSDSIQATVSIVVMVSSAGCRYWRPPALDHQTPSSHVVYSQ